MHQHFPAISTSDQRTVYQSFSRTKPHPYEKRYADYIWSLGTHNKRLIWQRSGSDDRKRLAEQMAQTAFDDLRLRLSESGPVDAWYSQQTGDAYQVLQYRVAVRVRKRGGSQAEVFVILQRNGNVIEHRDLFQLDFVIHDGKLVRAVLCGAPVKYF